MELLTNLNLTNAINAWDCECDVWIFVTPSRKNYWTDLNEA